MNKQSKKGVAVPRFEEKGSISSSVPTIIIAAKPNIIVLEDDNILCFGISTTLVIFSSSRYAEKEIPLSGKFQDDQATWRMTRLF